MNDKVLEIRSRLLPKEQEVLNHLAAAWNAFTELGQAHADQDAEFCHGIHALQYQIMARPTRRVMNGVGAGLCVLDPDTGKMETHPHCAICNGSGHYKGNPCDGIPF